MSANTGNSKGEVASTENSTSVKEDPESEEEKPKENQKVAVTSEDSTNVHSVNKFNFVFYFIYKLKYNEEENDGGYFDFLF